MTGFNFIPRSRCHKTTISRIIMFKKIKVIWPGIV